MTLKLCQVQKKKNVLTRHMLHFSKQGGLPPGIELMRPSDLSAPRPTREATRTQRSQRRRTQLGTKRHTQLGDLCKWTSTQYTPKIVHKIK